MTHLCPQFLVAKLIEFKDFSGSVFLEVFPFFQSLHEFTSIVMICIRICSFKFFDALASLDYGSLT